ncbi:hypothetical protein [Flavobacterium sp.]|uniref:hypothetical protein n=1 Tax=Flavobacterium sp. TaxID=239 RepID=UPI003751E941
MKTNFFKVSILALVTIFTISCSKDDSSSSTDTNTSGGTTINTNAKFTVATPTGVVKPNYIVLMFDQPFSPTATLPPIIKQETSDANGLVNFNLNSLVTTSTPKKYYFEVFTLSGTTYTLKTTFFRFDNDFVKGSQLTTTLLVNN